MQPTLGAHLEPGSTTARFGLYAEPATACAVRLFHADGSAASTHPMHPVAAETPGYFTADVEAAPGALYKFVVDDRELPDPFARFLPRGVHGPAMLVAPSHRWRHGRGVERPIDQQVIYELHVGTFSPEGTFEGVRRRLPALAELGLTAVELMPIGAFAGTRGWGYEGVALYAPFAPYGTPDELRALVDEAHGLGLSMLLDVVYNHFGPSGNYLPSYSGSFFSHELRNAWGDVPNYAHPVMRRLILDNAREWLEGFRFDGLRLDATHAMFDRSPRPILDELVEMVGALRPRKLLIAEDERNDAGLITRVGLDAVWADDFHHAVRVTLTGERDGYYAGYQPGVAGIAHTINHGWFYEGQVYPPTGKPRGTSAAALDHASLIYCIQNHDQIGNRPHGDRLTDRIGVDAYRAVSTLLLFLPATPLLFMGQEWAASAPFIFFTDHDEELGRLVSQGRRDEFRYFQAFADPSARQAIPDPQDEATFKRSRVDWQERERGEHARTLAFYQALLRLRRTDPVLRSHCPRAALSAQAAGDVLHVRRAGDAGARHLLVNFGAAPVALNDLRALAIPAETTVLLRTDDPSAGDRVLAPRAAVVLLS